MPHQAVRAAIAIVSASTLMLAAVAGCRPSAPTPSPAAAPGTADAAPAPAPAPSTGDAAPSPGPSASESPVAVSNNPAPPGRKLKKIDLSGMVEAGLLEIQSNAPNWIRQGFRRATDGDTSTLSRTNRIDPLILTLMFDSPVNLKSVRIFPSHAPRHDWSVLAGPDDVRYTLVEAPGDGWSRMDLPTAVNTRRVTLEVARPGPDDYVHVNEVELYEPADAALAPATESLPPAPAPAPGT
jgi:hypothetical protein